MRQYFLLALLAIAALVGLVLIEETRRMKEQSYILEHMSSIQYMEVKAALGEDATAEEIVEEFKKNYQDYAEY